MTMSPGEVVTEFIRRIGQLDIDGACELLAPDIHYDNVPMEPKHDGRDTVRDVLKMFLGASPTVEWRVERQTATGSVVMNERVDCFEMGGKPLAIPVAGIFEVNDDGLITLWRDYFDLQTVTNQAT
jgi:limonene-1,2-epoxide hydrolase